MTFASFQSMWGKAYRYWSLKLVFLLCIFIFEVGSLICAVAPNSTCLIVGRAIAGLGGAGVASGAYTILAFSAPPKTVAAYTGILGAVYAIASVIGPIIGGIFTDNATWRWCFYVNLPVGAVSAGIIVLIFQTPKQATPQKATLKEKILQMDLPGTALFLCALVCLILALQWGGTTKSWRSADVIGCVVGFILLIITFIGVEIYQDERALLIPRIMKQKSLILMASFQIFGSAAFMMFMVSGTYSRPLSPISPNIPTVFVTAVLSSSVRRIGGTVWYPKSSVHPWSLYLHSRFRHGHYSHWTLHSLNHCRHNSRHSRIWTHLHF